MRWLKFFAISEAHIPLWIISIVIIFNFALVKRKKVTKFPKSKYAALLIDMYIEILCNLFKLTQTSDFFLCVFWMRACPLSFSSILRSIPVYFKGVFALSWSPVLSFVFQNYYHQQLYFLQHFRIFNKPQVFFEVLIFIVIC